MGQKGGSPMKKRFREFSLSSLMLLLLLATIVASLFFVMPSNEAATTLVSVFPSSVVASVGQNFSINLDVSNVSDLYGWEFKMNWTASLLNLKNATEGPFLKSAGSTFFYYNLNATTGDVTVDETLTGDIPGVSGSGVLTTITFNVLGLGQSPLNLYYAVLINSLEQAIPCQLSGGYVNSSGSQGVYPTGGIVGITGYKLQFNQTMGNSLSMPTTIDYYWNFTTEQWNGAQWIASAISGSSTPVNGFSIPAYATVGLTPYVYLLPISGPDAVVWGEWLKVSYSFHWTFNGTSHSTSYISKLNVHAGDIAGAAVTFPYLGADGKVSTADLTLLASNWGKMVAWTGTFDPTDALHRTDISMNGKVSTLDLTILARSWGKSWSDTPPSG